MCGRFVLFSLGKLLAERFELKDEPEIEPRYNIAPSQDIAVIRPDESGDRRLVKLRWGLIPFWAKDKNIGYKMINARSESVAEKPAFRAAFKHRRCLIPADGFYEWRKREKDKQPFLFRIKDEHPFAFAGLWEHWESEEEGTIESCTILTTEANELLYKVHDRMPVILDPGDYARWLDTSKVKGNDATKLLKPFDAAEMIAYPVDTRVNSPKNDTESCVEPIEGPTLETDSSDA